MRFGIALLLALAPTVRGGGSGFFGSAHFAPEPYAWEPEYLRGRLGVLRADFHRHNLVVAYRHLVGVPFGPDFPGAVPTWVDPVAQWRKLRASVLGAPDSPPIQTERPGTSYSYFRNCLPDAFDNASRTLNERVGAFGASHPGVKSWIAAQDIVFANCAKGVSIPPEPEPGLPAVLRADREYQIAAAHFYSGYLDEAYGRFRKIAEDRESPWSTIAPYLAARCLIRQSTLQGEAKLERALEELDAVIADPRLAAHRGAAKSLRNWVLLRARPQEAADRASAELRDPANDDRFGRNIRDLDYAMGRQKSVPRDDLGEWLAWMARPDAAGAIRKWGETGAPQWFVAASMVASGGDPAAPELIRLAERIPPNSPAYATALFHRLRILTEQGKHAAVRAELDRKLPALRRELPVSAVNLLLGQRLRLATSLEEFLRAAPRKPVRLHPGGRSVPVPDTLFDRDAIQVFNNGLPLSALERAKSSPALPEPLRTRILMLAFTRAVVIGRHDVGVRLAPELAARRPSIAALLESYRTATSPEDRAFAAAFLVLRAPGLSITMGPPHPQRDEVRVDRRAEFKANWWCAVEGPAAAPAFLTVAERRRLEQERAALANAGTGRTWIARIVVERAEQRPEDPRLPEALHRVVQSARDSDCWGNRAEPFETAFRLLHRGWPRSEWARKTPYWFR